MARSLHELAARIERWSGAASTPPPAAPPLPDPTMQALAERFPGAPEHWLRMVASRMGLGPIETAGSANNPAAQSRRMDTAQPRSLFPQQPLMRRPAQGPDFPAPQLAGAEAPRFPAPVDLGSAEAATLRLIGANQSAPLEHARFAAPLRTDRSEPSFPRDDSSRSHVQGQIESVDSTSDPAPAPRFPDDAPRHSRFSPRFAQAETTPAARFPELAAALADPADRQDFTALGGEWEEGYEIRQPAELRSIWPALPVSDSAVPDALPLPPDEELIRLEQMVARWSA